MKISQITKVELLKLFNIRSYILFAVFLVINFLIAGGLYSIEVQIVESLASNEGTKHDVDASNSFNFFISNWSWFSMLFIVFFVSNNIGTEYRYGTMRKNIVDGFSRKKYFLGKIIIIAIVVFLFFFASVFEFIVSRNIVISDVDSIFKGISLSGCIRLWGGMFVYACIALFLCFVLKNSSGVIISIICYSFFEKILIFFASVSKIDYVNHLPLRVFNKITDFVVLSPFDIIQILTYLFFILSSSYFIFFRQDI